VDQIRKKRKSQKRREDGIDQTQKQLPLEVVRDFAIPRTVQASMHEISYSYIAAE